MPLSAPYLLTSAPPAALAALGWAVNTVHRRVGRRYRPVTAPYRRPLAVVSPVYREDPLLFRRALRSWLADEVSEVVCVIHEDDRACLDVARRFPVRVLTTDRADKRDALRRGWQAVSADLVALVDSDVVWAPGVADAVRAPFADPRVGGVATAQYALDPDSFWEYAGERFKGQGRLPAFTAAGRAMMCVIGRTGVYRRTVLTAVADDFVNESFLGRRCVVGDDTRLTELTLRAGYRTVYQRTARVWSRYPGTGREFLGQRLRNARNFWRVRLTALVTGWVWRYPYLAFGTLTDVISRGGFWLCEIYLVLLAVDGQPLVPAAVGACYVLHRAVTARTFVRRHALPRWHVVAQIAIELVLRNLDLVGLLTMRRQTWLTRHAPPIEDENAEGFPRIGEAWR
ncbi:glycosyltransferase [Streptomyces sp. I05A-00742]|uniref:glycosyltransferase n=1 Tax=Streptomyces sp. I05A-00742 TaxID=2732853 RepID=UPI001487C7F0|nr:glycosyltransferase [Streptomyces sp. I05A-00742]